MAAASDYVPRGFPKEIFLEAEVEDKILCCHCSFVLKGPVQNACGHRFCGDCLRFLTRDPGKVVRCPQCVREGFGDDEEARLSDQCFPDNAIKREYYRKSVRCSNGGCPWTGIFKDFESHSDGCEFKEIRCACGEMIPVQQKAEHDARHCPLIIQTCPHCEQEYTRRDMESHFERCPKMEVLCELCDIGSMPREQLIRHQVGDCARLREKCPLGCPKPITRGQMAQHKEHCKVQHVDYLSREAETLRNEIRRLRENNESTPGGAASSDSRLPSRMSALEGKLEDAEKLLADLLQQASSTGSVPAEGAVGGVASSADSTPTVTRADGATDTQLQETLQAIDNRITTFEGIITVMNREIERSLLSIESLESQRGANNAKMAAQEENIRKTERTMELKEVTLSDLSLRIQALEETTYDGTYTWRISEFARRRQDAINGRISSIYSPYFFTSRTGYKMCGRIYLNGDGMGRGSHISLFFVILRGKHDALLRWPFRQKVTMTILDHNNREHAIDAFRPDPTSSSFKRPTSDMNIASGFPLFLPLTQAEGASYGYVKDDTIFVKVQVDTSDL